MKWLWVGSRGKVGSWKEKKSIISRHIKNIFTEVELERNSVVAKFATTTTDAKIKAELNYQEILDSSKRVYDYEILNTIVHIAIESVS